MLYKKEEETYIDGCDNKVVIIADEIGFIADESMQSGPRGNVICLAKDKDNYILCYYSNADTAAIGEDFFSNFDTEDLARGGPDDEEIDRLITEREAWANEIIKAAKAAKELCPEAADDMDWYIGLAEEALIDRYYANYGTGAGNYWIYGKSESEAIDDMRCGLAYTQSSAALEDERGNEVYCWDWHGVKFNPDTDGGDDGDDIVEYGDFGYYSGHYAD